LEKIGLICGNRRFPLIFAQQASNKGYHVVALAIKGNTSRMIKDYAREVYWIDIREVNKMFEIFRRENIHKIAMAGQINPSYLFNRKITESQEIKSLFKELQDRKAGTIFGLIADRLNKEGFELIDSNTFMEDFLPKKCVLTIKQPDFNTWQDIYFGLDLAKKIAYLDIGQTVAVKNKAIVAIEALEGTDNLIRRAGKISGGGITIVKVSRPQQDMRFDIPVVGLNSVKNLVKMGALCLAIEAEKTLFIDKEPGIKLADKKGISIVAV
jgi:DUF1009 family protein